MSDFDKRLGKICVLDSMDPVLRCFYTSQQPGRTRILISSSADVLAVYDLLLRRWP